LALCLLSAVLAIGTAAWAQDVRYPECQRALADLREDDHEGRLTEGGMREFAASRVPGGIDMDSRPWIQISPGFSLQTNLGDSVAFLASLGAQALPQESRLALYALTVEEDYRLLVRGVSLARAASECFGRAVDQAEGDRRVGGTSDKETAARAGEIRDGAEEARRLVDRYGSTSMSNAVEYEALAEREGSRQEDRPSPGALRGAFAKAKLFEDSLLDARGLMGGLQGISLRADALLASARKK
jgi:hypothetical protein